MRQTLMTAVALVAFAHGFSQIQNKNLFNRFYTNHLKTGVEKKKTQLFVEINPQFFAFDGFGAGAGLEFSRIQTGFIYLTTKLTPAFRDAIFDQAKNLTVPNNSAAEVFANVFLRKDRKGLYAGSILSYDWYKLVDDATQQSEKLQKLYLVARVGFRWFPFQEFVYIDGGYGVSFNLNPQEKRNLGNSSYTPKSLIALPFFAVGGRFFINQSAKK
jgi:hypothetical protein